MNDRELLERAATAAGLEGYKYDSRMQGSPMSKELRDKSGRFLRYATWNPLTDDGDALRLAVKLRIMLEPCMAMGRVFVEFSAHPVGRGDCIAHEPIGGDAEAAARRAIVCAAAALANDR